MSYVSEDNELSTETLDLMDMMMNLLELVNVLDWLLLGLPLLHLVVADVR